MEVAGPAGLRPPPCDLLIFVATKTEIEQLQRAAADFKLPFEDADGDLGPYYNLGTVGTNRVLVVQTAMGPLTHKGSASRAIYYLLATQATAVIGIGMAFGIDRTSQKLGDVLVATGILPYDNDRLVEPGSDGRPVVNYSNIEKHASKASLVELLGRRAELPLWQGKVQLGLLLSGGARIRCRAYRDELVQQCGSGRGPVVGGDMEGVGFLSTSDPTDPRWIVVKGICDFADEERDAEIVEARPLACYNSAKFVIEALLAT